MLGCVFITFSICSMHAQISLFIRRKKKVSDALLKTIVRSLNCFGTFIFHSRTFPLLTWVSFDVRMYMCSSKMKKRCVNDIAYEKELTYDSISNWHRKQTKNSKHEFHVDTWLDEISLLCVFVFAKKSWREYLQHVYTFQRAWVYRFNFYQQNKYANFHCKFMLILFYVHASLGDTISFISVVSNF